jgi:hypothetical protein
VQDNLESLMQVALLRLLRLPLSRAAGHAVSMVGAGLGNVSTQNCRVPGLW